MSGKAGQAQATLPVTVSLVPVASVVLTPADSLACFTGGTVTFFAKALDANGNLLYNRVVNWAASPTSVATVSGGIVQCVAPGTAAITATIANKADTGKVVVSPVPVASVSLVPSGTQSCLIGGAVQLTAAPKDANGNPLTGRSVTWSSAPTAIATVAGGSGYAATVQCVSIGSALVTATVEGKQASDSVTVSAVPVASVSLKPAGQQACSVGGSLSIVATAKDYSGQRVERTVCDLVLVVDCHGHGHELRISAVRGGWFGDYHSQDRDQAGRGHRHGVSRRCGVGRRDAES